MPNVLTHIAAIAGGAHDGQWRQRGQGGDARDGGHQRGRRAPAVQVRLSGKYGCATQLRDLQIKLRGASFIVCLCTRITPEGKQPVTADTASKTMRALFEEDVRARGRYVTRLPIPEIRQRVRKLCRKACPGWLLQMAKRMPA